MSTYYVDVRLDAIDQTVRVGYMYEPGDEMTPDGVTVEEVWLHDVDIAPVLDPALFEYLEADVSEANARQAKDDYEEWQFDLAQQRIDEGDHL